MRRAAVVAALGIIVGTLVGCAGSPEWVRKGHGAFEGKDPNSFYAVGVAAPSPNQQVQSDMAKANGRAELARSQQVYVADLIKQFVREHRDFFDEEYASSVQFYQQVGRQVTETTLIGSRMVDSWRDRYGKMGRKGTLYVLMAVRADDEFFDAVRGRYAALVREHQARLLKKEADAALEELDKELEKARRSPLGPLGGLAPEEGAD